MKKVAVIGSGFAGLSSAAWLAKAGFAVTVFEKNASPGGRARRFEVGGFSFDMGPSWYWMPGVFENFFNHFGKASSDFYALKRLDPSYRIYFGKNDLLDIPSGMEPLAELFERLEPGSARRLHAFLKEAECKYALGIERLAYRPGVSLTELLDVELLKSLLRLRMFQPHSQQVRRLFRHPVLIQILEFPVLFLGSNAEKTPALYSLMNYADMVLGTWYPMGGMYSVVEAMVKVAGAHGVNWRFNTPVTGIEVRDGRATGIRYHKECVFDADYVVAGADYHHVEQRLIPPGYQQYGKAYWNTRIMAPSSLIFFLGVNKRLRGLSHHTLFFDTDSTAHADEIYKDPRWPAAPQFYVSCPSLTDPSVAPGGCENLFVLVPVASGLNDQPAIRQRYFEAVMDRLEDLTGQSIRRHITFSRSYAHSDFIRDYNAFKGNAYGLANTLFQTANFKPRMLNRLVGNLFYTGQLTVPGPGVPPAIISGQVVAQTLMKQYARQTKTRSSKK